jgi:hypothetical protein
MRSHAHSNSEGAIWHVRFAHIVRLVVAPLLLFVSGFFTADFLLSGVYTWPQTSRVVALTITIVVLAYEFVYKEQRAHFPQHSQEDDLRILLYSCMIPYAIGALALMALARLAS